MKIKFTLDYPFAAKKKLSDKASKAWGEIKKLFDETYFDLPILPQDGMAIAVLEFAKKNNMADEQIDILRDELNDELFYVRHLDKNDSYCIYPEHIDIMLEN